MAQCMLITGRLAYSATSLKYLFPSPQSQWRIAIPCPYEERILPISLGVSPCEICILSGSKKMAWPPRRVIPASKELRVRVEEKKKSINRVLSSSKRVGRSSPHFILRSKARCSTVSNSSLVHSCVLIKSRPRKLVFIEGPFYCSVADVMNERRLMDRTYFMSFHYPRIYAKRSDSEGVGTRFIASTPSALRGITLHIRHDPGTCLSCKGLAYGFGHSNQCSTPTSLEIADDSFNLWPHTAPGKMTLFVVPPGLTECNAIEVKLIGLLEVQSSFLDSGGDQQEVSVQFGS